MGPCPGEALTLSFEARLAAGDTFSWDWVRSMGRLLRAYAASRRTGPRVHEGRDAASVLTRISCGLLTSREPGGRATPSRLRSSCVRAGAHPRRRAAGACGCKPGVPAAAQAVKPQNLGPDWRPVELEWTAPAASESSIIRVVLNDFDGLSYDVRDVKLYELTGGRERRLEPTLQEGVGLTLVWGNEMRETQAKQTFVPTSAWQPFRFSLSPPRNASSLQALLLLGQHAESGHAG